MLQLVALCLVGGRITVSPDSPRGRLRDLVASMKATHGGPAYVTEDALDDALSYAEDLVQDDEHGNECSEDAYTSACTWFMRQLSDPMASHLRPTQAIAARERFHGRTSLGLTLHMKLIPEEEDETARSMAATEVESSSGSVYSLLATCGAGPRSWLRRWRRGWRRAAVVMEIAAGSPAAHAGIQPGDELLEVGGQPCVGPTRAAALELLESGVEGSSISVTCRRQQQESRRVAASASRESLATTRTFRLRRVAIPPATVRCRDLAHGTAHLVVISSFGSTTAGELRAALRALRSRPQPPPATLVFDLRGNEGGLLPEAIAACRMLLPAGGHVVSLRKEAPPQVAHAYHRRWWHRCELPFRIITMADAADGEASTSSAADEASHAARAEGRRRALASHAGPPPAPTGAEGDGEEGTGAGAAGGRALSDDEWGGVRHMPGTCAPLVVLVNDASASSAEVFAGALAHAGGAQVIGQRTYGKGSSQAVVYQRDGYAISFTAYTLAVGRRRGEQPLRHGVEPDVPWRWRAPRSVRAANDAEIERALSAAASAWRKESQRAHC